MSDKIITLYVIHKLKISLKVAQGSEDPWGLVNPPKLMYLCTYVLMYVNPRSRAAGAQPKLASGQYRTAR